MPSKSKKQRRAMAMAAHDPKAAKQLGVPQNVAKDYNKADKRVGLSTLMKKRGKRK